MSQQIERRNPDSRPERTVHEDIRDRRAAYAISAFENLNSITSDEAVLKRIRRLWGHLYNLGVDVMPGDDALITFLNEQRPQGSTSVDGDWGTQVIDLLRGQLARAGVKWHAHREDVTCILAAQERRCVQLGILQWIGHLSMRSWKCVGASDWWHLPGDRALTLIATLGFDIRHKQAERAAAVASLKSKETPSCQ